MDRDLLQLTPEIIAKINLCEAEEYLGCAYHYVRMALPDRLRHEENSTMNWDYPTISVYS